jgi:alpha-ketoglutarate-dependent taurine dioxygenase
MPVTSGTSLRIEPLPATLGARVEGVRLADLDDPTWAAIEDAFHTWALLVFPGQHLGDDEQLAFARRFGSLEPGLELVAISNVTPEGEIRPVDGPIMHTIRGNEGWHTDSSYMPRAAKASMLSARVVPSSGGETEWADMRAAYDDLEPDVRARVDTLWAYHSIRYSQARAGLHNVMPGAYGHDVDEPPLRPLVKVHPVTGRRALFIGRHAHAIPGLPREESDQLLDDLLDAACQPPRVYRHRWQPGDVAVWDNRCVLHRARPYDYDEPRIMKHSRIAGQDTEIAGGA